MAVAVADIRERLDALHRKPGIDIAEEAKFADRRIENATWAPPLTSCFTYALRQERQINPRHALALMRIAQWTDTPRPSDLAWYVRGGEPKHLGVYVGEEMVRSKWGEGPALRHPPLSVPSRYGELRYSRPLKQEDVDAVIAAFDAQDLRACMGGAFGN